MVYPQSLVHNERTQAIFKLKTQQTFRTLTEKNTPARRTRQASNVDAVKNETLSATGQKARTA